MPSSEKNVEIEFDNNEISHKTIEVNPEDSLTLA